jgi:hypothetical protein
MTAQFTEKFIAFVDILGFKKMVENAEAGKDFTLAQLFELLQKLGDARDKASIEQYGPTTCPEAPKIRSDIDFQLTQISDCVVVSAEVSPAGAINLIGHCWKACMGLLTKGVLCRGYITRGNIYHTNNQFMGTGYVNAYLNEAKVSAFRTDATDTGTPYIEIDPQVSTFIADQPDETVKKVFKRLTAADKDITVIFPFTMLTHSFAIGHAGGPIPEFNSEKEKETNAIMRANIERLKEKVMELVDQGDEKAFKKANHYIRVLDVRIAQSDQIDRLIDNLSRPYGAVATKENLPGLFWDKE